ncbi:hypothetical protein ACH5RR_006553 [Cinchona calisaya]|uniref:Uncharacterized protein n=1 Tax=Cinchona calisaya TaxID=153742 RepID=A0ABD3APB4_9GENT
MASMRTKIDVLVELEEIIMESIYIITMVLIGCNHHLNYLCRRSIVRYSLGEKLENQIKHLDRLIQFSDAWCVDNLRMNKNAFARLCYLLRENGGLVDSRHVKS